MDSLGAGHVHRRLRTDIGKGWGCDWAQNHPASGNCCVYPGKYPVGTGQFPFVYDDCPVYRGHRHCCHDPCDHGLYRHKFPARPSGERLFPIYADLQRIRYFWTDPGRTAHLHLWLARYAVGLCCHLCCNIHRLCVDSWKTGYSEKTTSKLRWNWRRTGSDFLQPNALCSCIRTEFWLDIQGFSGCAACRSHESAGTYRS